MTMGSSPGAGEKLLRPDPLLNPSPRGTGRRAADLKARLKLSPFVGRGGGGGGVVVVESIWYWWCNEWSARVMPRTYHRVEVKRAMSAVNGDEWSTGGDDKDRSSYSKGNPTRVAHSSGWLQRDICERTNGAVRLFNPAENKAGLASDDGQEVRKRKTVVVARL